MWKALFLLVCFCNITMNLGRRLNRDDNDLDNLEEKDNFRLMNAEDEQTRRRKINEYADILQNEVKDIR